MKQRLILLLILSFVSFQPIFAQWNQVISTIPNSDDVLDFSFVNDSVGFVAYVARVAKTTDYGDNWVDLSQFPFSGPNKVHFLTPLLGYAMDSRNLYRTTNGGSSWTNVKSGVSFVSDNFRDLYFTTTNIGYLISSNLIASESYIYKTTNFGNTWTTDTFPAQPLNSITFPTLDTGYIVGGAVGVSAALCIKTFDGGLTWNIDTLSQIGSLRDVHFLNNTIGYAVGNTKMGNELVKTTNAGQTWTYLNPAGPGTNHFNAVYFTSIDTGYAGGVGNRFMHTYNGGVTWTNSSSTGIIHDIHFISKNVGFLGGDFGKLLKTTSAGLLNTGITIPMFDQQIKFYPNPSKGKLSLELRERGRVGIYTINGRLLHIKDYNSGSHRINLSNLSTGVYYITFMGKSSYFSEKLLIQAN